MSEHELKCWPKVFQAQLDGVKGFEYRKNDRDYKTGDVLYQREWDPETQQYTGRTMRQTVGYIVYGGVFGIPEGYCIMDVRSACLLSRLEAAREAFKKLQDLRWTAVTDGSGPSDCTPNEKGLFRFVCQMHEIVELAFSTLPSSDLSRAREEVVEAADGIFSFINSTGIKPGIILMHYQKAWMKLREALAHLREVEGRWRK